jgi:hypothetical protein
LELAFAFRFVVAVADRSYKKNPEETTAFEFQRDPLARPSGFKYDAVHRAQSDLTVS